MTGPVMKRPGMVFVGELPKSDHPWQWCSYGDMVIMVNPDHPPMVVKEGKLEVLKIDGEAMTVHTTTFYRKDQ